MCLSSLSSRYVRLQRTPVEKGLSTCSATDRRRRRSKQEKGEVGSALWLGVIMGLRWEDVAAIEGRTFLMATGALVSWSVAELSGARRRTLRSAHSSRCQCTRPWWQSQGRDVPDEAKGAHANRVAVQRWVDLSALALVGSSEKDRRRRRPARRNVRAQTYRSLYRLVISNVYRAQGERDGVVRNLLDDLPASRGN
jgi:hypothetical protein